jgi:hypothetical protein
MTNSTYLATVVAKLSIAPKCFNLTESFGVDVASQQHANYLKNGY